MCGLSKLPGARELPFNIEGMISNDGLLSLPNPINMNIQSLLTNDLY